MSFCQDVKEEILGKKMKNEVFLPFLSGLIKSCGEFKLSKDGEFSIIIKTPNIILHKMLNRFVRSNYNSLTELRMDDSLTSIIRYVIIIPENVTEKIMYDTGIYDTQNNFNWGISNDILLNKENRIAFLKGVFIGCSNSSIILDDNVVDYTQKGMKIGGRLEFSFLNELLASDFVNLLAMEGIASKITTRKGQYIVYIKSSTNKSNFETLFELMVKIDAMKMAFKIKNTIIEKQIKNKTNRLNNCQKGNEKKTLTASRRQLEAIKAIKSSQAYDSLPDTLKEVCCLRLKNPTASISKLVELSDTKTTKSVLNRKLLKIQDISKNLKK